MVPDILCAVTGHEPPFVVELARTGWVAPEQPTVQDLLEYVAEYHELECGCGVVIVGRVWPSTAPLGEEALQCAEALSLHTSLESLADGSPVALVVLAVESGPNAFLRLARLKRFQSFTSDGGTVFRRTDNDQPVLPSPVAPSFASICTTPGSVWVDKSDAIQSLLAKFPVSRVRVMRRPRGFGKSTLLSMLDAVFDPCTTCAHFPFYFDHSIMSDDTFRRCRGQLLAFHLDLGDLSPYARVNGVDDGPALGLLEIQAKCFALLDAAAAKFYERYRGYLQAPQAATERPGFSPTFDQVLNWAQDQEYQLCFLIDNYTAPFISHPNPLFHFAVSLVIFRALDGLVLCKKARYAFLVGDDAPGVAKLAQAPAHWIDLTDDSAFSTAVGFTSSEVTALGYALSIDITSALQAALPDAQRGDARLVYSSADVLSLARELLDAGAISGHPPRQISVWRMADPPEDEETRDGVFRRNLELLFGQHAAADDEDDDMDEDEYLCKAMRARRNYRKWDNGSDAEEAPDPSFGSSNDSPKGSPPPEGQDWDFCVEPKSPLFDMSKTLRKSSVL